MTHSNKRIIERYLACIAIFQIIFLIGVFAFHNYLLTPNPFFRTLTLEEWNWLVQQKSGPNDMEILFVFTLLRDIFFVVFIVGICQILFAKQIRLPIRTFWKIVIPVAGSIVYIPLCYYFNCQADHYRLYMMIVPVEILSLIFLCLILIGLVGGKRINNQ